METTEQLKRAEVKGWFITLKKRNGRKLFTGVNFGETLPMTQMKAEELAAYLNRDDTDDWTYKVDKKLYPDDTIRAFIDAYDAEGKFAGTL